MIGRDGLARAAKITPDARTLKIRELNDALRVHGRGGMVLVTPGIVALGRHGAQAIYQAVSAFDDFNADNDPHGEHDCAILEISDERIMFKIDAYDRSRQFGSPDPTDPKVTVRVMTILLASEY